MKKITCLGLAMFALASLSAPNAIAMDDNAILVKPGSTARAQLRYGPIDITDFANADSRLAQIAGEDGLLTTQGEKLAALVWALNMRFQTCHVHVGRTKAEICSVNGATSFAASHPAHMNGLIDIVDKFAGDMPEVGFLLGGTGVFDNNSSTDPLSGGGTGGTGGGGTGGGTGGGGVI